MTKEEAEVLQAAKKIQAYCNKHEPGKCCRIFDAGCCCCLDGEPAQWVLPDEETEDDE